MSHDDILTTASHYSEVDAQGYVRFTEDDLVNFSLAIIGAASGQKLTEAEMIAALPKECAKVYGDYERGYNKALGHAAEKLRALLRASDSEQEQN